MVSEESKQTIPELPLSQNEDSSISSISSNVGREEKENMTATKEDETILRISPDIRLNRDMDIRQGEIRLLVEQSDIAKLKAESEEEKRLELIRIEGELEEIEKPKSESEEERILILQASSSLSYASSDSPTEEDYISPVNSFIEGIKRNSEQEELQRIKEEDEDLRICEEKHEQLQVYKAALFKRLSDVKHMLQPEKSTGAILSRPSKTLTTIPTTNHPQNIMKSDMPLAERKEALFRKIDEARSLLDKREDEKRLMILETLMAEKRDEKELASLMKEIEILLKQEENNYLKETEDTINASKQDLVEIKRIDEVVLTAWAQLLYQKLRNFSRIHELNEELSLIEDVDESIIVAEQELSRQVTMAKLHEEELLLSTEAEYLKSIENERKRVENGLKRYESVDEAFLVSYRDALARQASQMKEFQMENEQAILIQDLNACIDAESKREYEVIRQEEEWLLRSAEAEYFNSIDKENRLTSFQSVDETFVVSYRDALARQASQTKRFQMENEQAILIQDLNACIESAKKQTNVKKTTRVHTLLEPQIGILKRKFVEILSFSKAHKNMPVLDRHPSIWAAEQEISRLKKLEKGARLRHQVDKERITEEIEIILRVEELLHLESLDDETTSPIHHALSEFRRVDEGYIVGYHEAQDSNLNRARTSLDALAMVDVMFDMESRLLEVESEELGALLLAEETLFIDNIEKERETRRRVDQEFRRMNEAYVRSRHDTLFAQFGHLKAIQQKKHTNDLIDDLNYVINEEAFLQRECGFTFRAQVEATLDAEDTAYLDSLKMHEHLPKQCIELDEAFIDAYRLALSRREQNLKTTLEAEEEIRLIDEACWLMRRVNDIDEEGALRDFPALMAEEQARIRIMAECRKETAQNNINKYSCKEEQLSLIAKEAEEALRLATEESQQRKKGNFKNDKGADDTSLMNMLEYGENLRLKSEGERLKKAAALGKFRAIKEESIEKFRADREKASAKDTGFVSVSQQSRENEECREGNKQEENDYDDSASQLTDDMSLEEEVSKATESSTRSMRMNMDGTLSILQTKSNKEAKIQSQEKTEETNSSNVGIHVLTVVGLVGLYSVERQRC